MAGTIVTDRIESDASYASSINIASPVVISNTITVRSGSTNAFIIDSSGRASLGTTPSNWGSGGTLEFTGQGLGSIHNTGGYANFSFSRNSFFNPSSGFWNYKASSNAALYQIETEAHNFYGAASGTSSTPISWTQVLSFERGKTLALQGATTQTGTGITFPASQSASSDPNTLDDYEEGTWTPTIRFGGATTGITYNERDGYYVRIGRLGLISMLITLSSKGSATGDCTITGIPFSVTNQARGGQTSATFSTFSGSIYGLGFYASGTTIELLGNQLNGAVLLTHSNFQNTSSWRMTGVYIVD